MVDDLVSRVLSAIDNANENGFSADEVLRLCRSLRDIVALYEQAKAAPVRHDKGKFRGLDHASAMGRLTTLGLVLQSVARGLGIEDTDGSRS